MCSNHDCQLLANYDVAPTDGFIVWREVEGMIKKLNLEFGLQSAILGKVSLWIALRDWDHRKVTLSTCVKSLVDHKGAGGIVSSCPLTLLSHSHSYSQAKCVENSCEVDPDKVTSLSWAQFCPL